MKKSILLACVLMGLALIMASCTSTQVSYAADNSQNELSAKLSDTDLSFVAEALINDCANSTRIRNYKRANGENPLVIIGPIINQGSGHFDTNKLAKNLQTAIINSGSIQFAADSGLRFSIQSENDDYLKYEAADKAKEIAQNAGADLILQGFVRSNTDSSKAVSTYYIDLEMLDIETDSVLWQGENSDIKKQVKKSK